MKPLGKINSRFLQGSVAIIVVVMVLVLLCLQLGVTGGIINFGFDRDRQATGTDFRADVSKTTAVYDPGNHSAKEAVSIDGQTLALADSAHDPGIYTIYSPDNYLYGRDWPAGGYSDDSSGGFQGYNPPAGDFSPPGSDSTPITGQGNNNTSGDSIPPGSDSTPIVEQRNNNTSGDSIPSGSNGTFMSDQVIPVPEFPAGTMNWLIAGIASCVVAIGVTGRKHR